MAQVAHWDDAETETRDVGPVANTETWLSGAVDAVRLGVSRYAVAPGKAATPQHAEDEEAFFVLGGSGWSVQEDGCFAIGPGDVVFYGAYEPAHTVVAGDEGLSFIAFGTSDPPRGLEGAGVVTLGEEERPVRAGSIVGRPPATGVAHAFRAGDEGMTVLMFSDKHGSDMTYNPRTDDVLIRGLGVRITPS